MFERFILNPLGKYLEENKLLPFHQSDFRSSGSCANQLFLIIHNLYKAFDAYPTLELWQSGTKD